VYNWNLFETFENPFDFIMVEPLLSGIVLGLVPVTILGLFVTAFLQFRRSDQLQI
jgi:cytochrome b6-f complex subunit 5